MREILFRGFYPNENGSVVIVVNGQEVRGDWVEGYYVLCRKGHYILQQYDNNGYDDRGETCEWKEVIPETIGQYTGLTDKNGAKIFEGDKVKIVTETCSSKKGQIGYIEYSTDCACYLIIHSDKCSNDLLGNFFNTSLEVIGNIHDKEVK